MKSERWVGREGGREETKRERRHADRGKQERKREIPAFCDAPPLGRSAPQQRPGSFLCACAHHAHHALSSSGVRRPCAESVSRSRVSEHTETPHLAMTAKPGQLGLHRSFTQTQRQQGRPNRINTSSRSVLERDSSATCAARRRFREQRLCACVGQVCVQSGQSSWSAHSAFSADSRAEAETQRGCFQTLFSTGAGAEIPFVFSTGAAGVESTHVWTSLHTHAHTCTHTHARTLSQSVVAAGRLRGSQHAYPTHTHTHAHEYKKTRTVGESLVL